MCRLTGSPRYEVGFLINNAAMTRWQLHAQRVGEPVWMLAAHNDDRHLDVLGA